MPDLFADCFAAVGERLDDWLDLRAAGPGLPGAGSPTAASLASAPDPEAMTERDRRASAGRADAGGFRRYVDFVSELYRLRDARLHRPQLRLAAGPASGPSLARLARDAAASARLAPTVAPLLRATSGCRRLFSFQAMYAGLSPAAGARDLRGHHLHGLGRRASTSPTAA